MANVVLRTEEEHGERTIPRTPLPVSTEAVETVTLAPPVHAAIAPSSFSARRYDQATIEKALALAIEMQQEHQATLTAEQVVRLGEEINVDQAFVLKALSQLSPESNAATREVKQVQSQEPSLLRFRALPYTDKIAAVVIPSLFSLLSFFIFREMAVNSLYLPLIMYVVAPLMALFLGVRLRSKRLGFLSGALLGFLMVMAIWVSEPYPPTSADAPIAFLVTLAFAAAGAGLGVLAAIVARHGAKIYYRSIAALLRLFPGLSETDA